MIVSSKNGNDSEGESSSQVAPAFKRVATADVRHLFEGIPERHLSRQYPWDNSGSQLICHDNPVSGASICLDLTPMVLRRAIQQGHNLIISHHPLIFNPLKSVSNTTVVGSILIDAIRNNINILSYHTNLDLADYSLADYLLERAGLPRGSVYEYVGSSETIAGETIAGETIGDGSSTPASTSSTPASTSATSTPTSSTSTSTSTSATSTPASTSSTSTSTSATSTPATPASTSATSTPATPVLQGGATPQTPYGLGRVVDLPEPMTMDEVHALFANALQADPSGVTLAGGAVHNLPQGDADVHASAIYTDADADAEADTLPNGRKPLHGNTKFRRLALIPGSGFASWEGCLEVGADILVSGDLKHHQALDARLAGVATLDIGHGGSEVPFLYHIKGLLASELSLNSTVVLDNVMGRTGNK